MNGETPRKRGIVIGTTSVLAVLCCAAYVPFAAGEQAVASVGAVSYTNAKAAVVYGSVKKNGEGVAGAQVQIVAPRGRITAATRSGRLGTYRVAFQAKTAVYTIVLRKAPGSSVKATVHFRLKPGIHLRVSARLTGRGFFFMPFFHY
jgi:hypothetical protein